MSVWCRAGLWVCLVCPQLLGSRHTLMVLAVLTLAFALGGAYASLRLGAHLTATSSAQPLDLAQTTDNKTRVRRSGEGKEVPGAAQITLAQVGLIFFPFIIVRCEPNTLFSSLDDDCINNYTVYSIDIEILDKTILCK